MKTLSTEIEIKAPTERVWDLLTDFDAFSTWNPFMPRAAGEIKAGERLDITLQPPGGSGVNIKPLVLKAEPGRELRWIGRILMPGIFDGEHIFIIEPLGEDRVRFTQMEEFSGLLSSLMTGNLEQSTRSGFAAMNRALKARAERNC